MEVIAYLKKEDGQKEEELDSLRQQVKDTRVTALNDRDALVAEHEQKMTELENALNEKNEEVSRSSLSLSLSLSLPPPKSFSFTFIIPKIRVMQGELKTVREFRKRRAEMQQQLEQLQASLEASAYEHKTSLSNMEHRFFEEKLRLQKEANRRIAELAEKAHAEAVR